MNIQVNFFQVSMIFQFTLLFLVSVVSFTVLPKPEFTAKIDRFMVVDCLLPSQVRRLGTMTYAAARKAIKTSTLECEKRGGEFVAFDRASYASTLKVWLPLAQEGDAVAQTYIGETYEKGLGVKPDYATAASWYFKAAEQGFSRAQINLGNLFELGLGLDKDMDMALFWYQQASNVKGIKSPLSIYLEAKKKLKIGKTNKTKILIIEPEMDQRGLNIVSKQVNDQNKYMLIIGQVVSSATITQVLVNKKMAKIVGGSMFRSYIPANAKTIDVIAIDDLQHKTKLSFSLEKNNEVITTGSYDSLGVPFDEGKNKNDKYHALIIGNNHYQSLPYLDTASQDAKAMQNILEKHYGFSTTLLIDVDRYQILSALNDLKENFSENTHLLIYYAGHGQLDSINKRGYWLPVDAELNSPANWLSNIMITDMLNIIPAKQLLIIADSCYSGMMSRSALGVIEDALSNIKKKILLRSLSGAKSRIAFTSGGVAPVIDTLNGKHSVFANELLQALKQNKGALTGYKLFQAVYPQVKINVSKVGFEQIPEYAPLKFAGHEAGDFVFYKIK